MALRPRPSGSSWGKAFDLGLEFGLSVVVGFGLGYYLDRQFGTTPLFLLVFMGLGFAAGVRSLVRFAQKNAPDKEPTEPTDRDRP